MGFLELLTVIFIVLKLTGVITWSWWFVLMPGIISVIIYVVMIVLHGVAFNRLRKDVLKDFDGFDDWD